MCHLLFRMCGNVRQGGLWTDRDTTVSFKPVPEIIHSAVHRLDACRYDITCCCSSWALCWPHPPPEILTFTHKNLEKRFNQMLRSSLLSLPTPQIPAAPCAELDISLWMWHCHGQYTNYYFNVVQLSISLMKATYTMKRQFQTDTPWPLFLPVLYMGLWSMLIDLLILPFYSLTIQFKRELEIQSHPSI